MDNRPADCTCLYPQIVARNMSGHDPACPTYIRWAISIAASSAAPINLCTYFDQRYLAKGLALLQSIERHVPDYRACVLALDQSTLTTLRRIYTHDPRYVIL